MNLTKVRPEKVILLVGGPRSGTTWLAKIFDSHPDVLYRHEPDTVMRDSEFQRAFAPKEVSTYVAAARQYLERLLTLRDLKCVGSLPSFPKSYFSNLVYQLRHGLIFALRAIEQAGLAVGLKTRFPAPDCISPSQMDNVRVTMKSNASRMRIRLFAEALPGCKVVLILRDPFGHAASMRRGVELGKFEGDVSLDECLGTDEAQRYGLTREKFLAMTHIQQHAWHWVILNEKAVNDLKGVPGAMMLLYRDLCMDPVKSTKEMFAFVDLPWNDQTQSFIKQSTSAPSFDRYYQVQKESLESLNKWRTQLSETEQKEIRDIFCNTDLWALFPEFHDEA
jgi:hypothetical protein